MKLPTFKRILKQDFKPDQADLVTKLGYSLNQGIESLYDVLNKKVSIRDNILATIKDVEVIVDSAGVVNSGGVFNIDFQGQVGGLEIIKADNLTNSTVYPTTAPWPTWEVISTGIKILHVSGLPEKNLFRLRVLVWGL
jgi:hypothetical protein